MNSETHHASGAAVKAEAGAAPDVRPVTGGLFWSTVLLSWLLPGLGFGLRGRGGRAVAQALMVLITFIIGLALHGGVTWPSWSPGSPEFNLINNITFIIQLGAGLPALISLAAAHFNFEPLGGIPQNPYFELGSYYLVVAGAINYFAVCNLSDRFLRPQPRFTRRGESAPVEAPPES